MSNREEFEAWARKQKLGLTYGDCGYVFSSTEMAWRAWQAQESKCSALAAELSQAKSVVSECREYFIAGIMNRIRPTNEGYLHMRCDTLGDETPSHDAFLAEVRAQGVEMVIAYHRERADALHHVDRNNAIRHSMAALDASDVAAQLRQDANTAELLAAGIITKVGE